MVGKIIRGGVGLAVVALIVFALFRSQQQTGPAIVSGLVESDAVRVGSRVGGRVARVLVDEGSVVKRGDVLVELEPFELDEALAAARARLAVAAAELTRFESGLREDEIAKVIAQVAEFQARLAELEAGPRPAEIAAAQSRLDLAQAELELAQIEDARVGKMVAQGAASGEARDRARAALAVARAATAARRHELQLLEEGTRHEVVQQARARLDAAQAELRLAREGYRAELITGARAARDVAAAEVESVSRRRDELVITAPLDGVVEAVDLEPGDLVASDAPALTILDPASVHLRAWLPANLTGMNIGRELSVRLDAWPDRTFLGRVTWIATRAEFIPGNVQTPEDRSKLVFRIRVEPVDALDAWRPGMVGDLLLPDAD